MYVHVYIYRGMTRAQTFEQRRIDRHLDRNVYVSTCVYVQWLAFSAAYVSVGVYIYKYVYMYIYICIYVYIYIGVCVSWLGRAAGREGEYVLGLGVGEGRL